MRERAVGRGGGGPRPTACPFAAGVPKGGSPRRRRARRGRNGRGGHGRAQYLMGSNVAVVGMSTPNCFFAQSLFTTSMLNGYLVPLFH